MLPKYPVPHQPAFVCPLVKNMLCWQLFGIVLTVIWDGVIVLTVIWDGVIVLTGIWDG